MQTPIMTSAYCHNHYLRFLVTFAATGFLLIAVASAQSQQLLQQQQPFIWPASSILEQYKKPNGDGNNHKNHPSILYTLTLVGNHHDSEHRTHGHHHHHQVSSFNVTCTGFCNNQALHLLDAAMSRFRQTLQSLMPTPSNNNNDDGQKYPVNPHNATLHPLSTLHVHLSTNDTTLHPAVNESYVLQVVGAPPTSDDGDVVSYTTTGPSASASSFQGGTTSSSSIQLSAPTIYGAMRGLQSLWQLFQFAWQTRRGGGCHHPCHDVATVFTLLAATQPPLTIVDEPVYTYRGILVDTARHYLPLSLLQQQLQVMEYNKFNVLHWHLTDSQSFPYASKLYPELAQYGAYGNDGTCVYTARDIENIVQQAAMRGIRVVVEVDLPGHSQAIGKSHPEFLTLCGKTTDNRDPDTPNTKVPSEPLNATSDAVYEFVHNLYQELAALFPDPWIHVGGDEVPLQCWENNTQITTWMKEHGVGDRPVDLLAYFETKLLEMVTGRDTKKRPIVWQELFDLGLPLSNQTIVDVWMLSNMTTIHHATKLGFDVVLSACWYLDQLQIDWWGFYQCDPRSLLNDTTSSTEQKERIIGGHASMWAEHVDETNFMSRVWPRASAVGEKLWTGVSTRAQETSRERLYRFRCRMVQLGIPAQPIAPGYCGDDEKEVTLARLGTGASAWSALALD